MADVRFLLKKCAYPSEINKFLLKKYWNNFLFNDSYLAQ